MDNNLKAVLKNIEESKANGASKLKIKSNEKVEIAEIAEQAEVIPGAKRSNNNGLLKIISHIIRL
jgi:hypothetical protein